MPDTSIPPDITKAKQLFGDRRSPPPFKPKKKGVRRCGEGGKAAETKRFLENSCLDRAYLYATL